MRLERRKRTRLRVEMAVIIPFRVDILLVAFLMFDQITIVNAFFILHTYLIAL